MKTFFVLCLALLLVGCSLPRGFIPSTAPSPTPPATSSPTMQPTRTHQARPVSAAAARITSTQPARCVVSTGYDAGTVNVRGGPGMAWPVVDIVNEGQELPLYGQPVNGWQEVTTPALVNGWFYISKWCK